MDGDKSRKADRNGLAGTEVDTPIRRKMGDDLDAENNDWVQEELPDD